MGGTVSLPATVEVAFGANPLDTGTLTWTDISAYVKRTRGIDCSRGWDAESSQPMAGRMQFQVNNDDGRFTPGTTGAFGLIRNRLPVRLKQGSTVLWTGLVETWKVSWESGLRSLVDVTCVDRWAAIRRLRFEGDQIAYVMGSQSPAYLWPFTADKTTTNRAESSIGGSVLDSVYQPWFTATAPVMRAGIVTNPQSWLTDSRTLVSDGEYRADSGTGVAGFSAPGGVASFLPKGAASVAFTVSVWLKECRIALYSTSLYPPVPQIEILSTTVNGHYLALSRTGSIGSEVSTSSATASSGWHQYAVSVSVNGSGACTLKFYRDGALLLTDTTSWTTSGWNIDVPKVHMLTLTDGAFCYLGIWNSALSDAQILEQYQAGSTQGVAGETASVRAARLLTYIDSPPTVTTTGTFTSTMSKQDLVDKSLADALQECATAEGGTIYMSTAGWPVLTSRSWRTSASVAFTIPAKALGADVTWTLDDQQLTNSASVDRMVGDTTAGSVKAKNDTSVTTYGEQNTSVQIWVDTDAQLLERANAEANMWANPLPRSSELVVDMATKGATLSAATVLAADVGNRIAVSGMPATAPTQTEFFIESIADKITEKGWTRTFTVSPRLDYFTVENATFGVIDSTNVLAF